MAASTNDLLKKTGSNTVTTLSAPGKALAATSINVGSTTNYPTDTGIVIAIRQVDANGALIAGTYSEYSATVSSATSLDIEAVPVLGSDQVYPAGSTTQVYIPVSSYAQNKLVDWGLEHANQDGSLITQAVRDALNLDSGSSDGWTPFGYSLTSITALGNRSYTAVVSGTDTTGITSVGQRLKLPRTVTAPTQCTSLNGSTQYYTKTSPAGMTQIDDITVVQWVKPSAYQVGHFQVKSTTPGTNGWRFYMNAEGTVTINGNARYATSYQSLPLNKWTHVAATLDMSTSTVTMYFDGVLVPSGALTSAGASFTDSGNYSVGAQSSGTQPFAGKMAQVGLFSSVLSQATIRALMNQTLTGAESTLVSAYTFNGATGINDLSANANNLTAQGSALATNDDTPFTNAVTGTNVVAGTTNYGIIMSQTFSTNTTYTVQIPEGETLPTTGGIGTVSYSTQNVPYGFPRQKDKWRIKMSTRTQCSQNSPTANTFYNPNSQLVLNVPIGEWDIVGEAPIYLTRGSGNTARKATLATTAGNTEDSRLYTAGGEASPGTDANSQLIMNRPASLAAATNFYINFATTASSVTAIYALGDTYNLSITAENAYL